MAEGSKSRKSREGSESSGEEDLGTLLWEYEIVIYFSSRNHSPVKICLSLA